MIRIVMLMDAFEVPAWVYVAVFQVSKEPKCRFDAGWGYWIC